MSPFTKLPDCVTARETSTHALTLFFLVFLFPQIEQESFRFLLWTFQRETAVCLCLHSRLIWFDKHQFAERLTVTDGEEC